MAQEEKHCLVLTKEEQRAIIEDLRLIDDVFMTWVFADHPECVELTLRIILDMPKLEVISMETQKKIANLQGKSAIFDVVATDGERTFNVEVQRKDSGAAPKRARYHSSLMDANTLLAGEEYEDLPETYVIFVTENDVLKMGKPLYLVERCILGTGEKIFGDKAHIVYVNGEIRDDTPLGRLMQDFFCRDAKAMHYAILRERVSMIKETEEGESNMSKLLEDMINNAEARGEARGRAEGEARGRAEGEARGRAEGESFGFEVGILDSLMRYINKKKVSIEAALEDMDVPPANRPRYTSRLQTMLAGA